MDINNHIEYNYLKSFGRIDQIINTSDNDYQEVTDIPTRDKLTFNNGFYVDCCAMFVDIRGSSELPSTHRRPTLAKIYRSYVSEVVSIISANEFCTEVSIVGDCVSGIFSTKSNLNEVLNTAAKVVSLIKVLNYKLEKKGIKSIKVGIGISFGRALMIKAGYLGSGINDVVWMGDVVNEASKLCSNGNRECYDMPVMVSSTFYERLTLPNKSELLKFNQLRRCYHGNIVNSEMDKWFNENCK